MDKQLIAYQGEVMLLGWSETHTGGAKVTFALPDAEALVPFKAMTVAKGKTAGQRLACVLVLIGDDEKPVEPPKPAEVPESQPDADRPKGGDLARLAGILCGSAEFRKWYMPATGADADAAARKMREHLGIESRAELDHDEMAAHQFHAEIRKPWVAFLAEQE